MTISRAKLAFLVFYCILFGMGLLATIQMSTGFAQDIPGTGGLTRYQLAEMLVECDGDKPEGYCVADINLRVTEKE